jgi:hypothetical protein
MVDYVDSVNEYLRSWRKLRTEAEQKGEIRNAQAMQDRIIAIEGVISELENLRRITKPIPASYGDLSDLPAELVKELSGIKVDDLEEQLFTIIKSGEEVDLDAILIELFRRFEVVQTRKFLQNKLWRMVQKGIVYSVPRRKGVYTATEPVDEFTALASPARSAPTPNTGGSSDELDDDIPF